MGNPFWNDLGAITPGKTTRDEVHELLGEPWYPVEEWDVELYYKREGALAFPFPVPHMATHYLLVVYQEAGVVSAVDSFHDWGEDYYVQKRIDGYEFVRSGTHVGLWRIDPKKYIELPDPKLYPTPESTKLIGEQRKRQQLEARIRDQKRIARRTNLENRAQAGDPEAQLQLYHLDQVPHERLKWLCRSADQGYPAAQLEVGRLHWKGVQGVKQDLRIAYVWYSLAARGGYKDWDVWELRSLKSKMTPDQTIEATNMLEDWQPGQCEHSLVAAAQAKRQQELVFEIAKAANEGDPEAQLQFYYSDPNAPDALRWLCRSADQGHPHAMNEMASLYRTGRGELNQDLARAYLWYSLAVRAGHEEYRWRLEEVAESMTPEQTAKAAEMLGEWRPGQCERDLRMGQHED